MRPVEERIAIMRRYKEIIEEHADALAKLISKETAIENSVKIFIL